MNSKEINKVKYHGNIKKIMHAGGVIWQGFSPIFTIDIEKDLKEYVYKKAGDNYYLLSKNEIIMPEFSKIEKIELSYTGKDDSSPFNIGDAYYYIFVNYVGGINEFENNQHKTSAEFSYFDRSTHWSNAIEEMKSLIHPGDKIRFGIYRVYGDKAGVYEQITNSEHLKFVFSLKGSE